MKNKSGFTLIELVVVIAIIALLASYAIPNYRQYVVRSKRVEAQDKVLQVAGMYEKFYANTNAYPTNVTGGGTALSLTNSFLRWKDYRIVHQNRPNNGWRIRAVARGKQATDDPSCIRIQYDNLGQKTPAACWE
ncbi:type IV pilin protein [Marinicella rhabdoformis]|uniref:type IV pilin protein n=1 Tax=Marinicella rhabdoformis TaxID=2580566 RepID=UPI0012AEDB08|nr:type IV pilin protein [Marinicella rhabdoformis]